MEEETKQVLSKVSREVTGPVLMNFVLWILKEAQRRDITTLYFLARDGYVLHKIACHLTQQFQLPIECKYLYCSRKSLRIPTYHLIGEEAYELLFLGGYHVTPQSILDRAGLNENQKQAVLHELALSEEFCHTILGKTELVQFTQRLRRSKSFCEGVLTNSKKAYPDAIAYLRQEGVLNQKHLAIVDSGWVGSMQRSLRQLLESVGFKGQITGFYFGMYSEPEDRRDGEYLTWYFNKRGSLIQKICFCNNLFECMLSAPHGMTLGYQKKNRKIYPVFSEILNKECIQYIQIQINIIVAYVVDHATAHTWENFNKNLSYRTTEKLLKRFMVKPTVDEVKVYGSFLFDDDILDKATTKLAGIEQQTKLGSYLFLNRLLRKLGIKPPIEELFWVYGTIVFLPKKKQIWYRWNLYIWELLKYGFY